MVIFPVAGNVPVHRESYAVMKPFEFNEKFENEQVCREYGAEHIVRILEKHGVPADVRAVRIEDLLRERGMQQDAIPGQLEKFRAHLGLKPGVDVLLAHTFYKCVIS